MPADPHRHVRDGEPVEFSARAQNAQADAARAEAMRRLSQASRWVKDFRQATIVPVKNSSPTDRARFDVLGLDSTLLGAGTDGFKQRPMVNGSTPAAGTHEGRFGILIEPCKVTKIGRAVVSGVTIARVAVKYAWHRYAEILDNDCTALESRAEETGCAILWKEGGTGTKWAIVKIGVPPRLPFPAKITGVAWQTGGRYSYMFVEVEKTAATWDGWTTKDQGRTGTAYNLIECLNSDGACPAQVGEVVLIREESYDDAGSEAVEYWFQYEEYDNSSSSGGDEESSGLSGHLDVVICDPYRSGDYIYFPQRRLQFNNGHFAGIGLLPDTWFYICCPDNSSSGETSSGETSSGDVDSCDPCLEVSGTLTPAGGAGEYLLEPTLWEGKCWWNKGNYYVRWNALGYWEIVLLGDPENYWYKSFQPETPLGDYAPSLTAGGTATVGLCDSSGEPCDNCDGRTPAQIAVTIAGIVNNVTLPECEDCEQFNGTFTLDQVAESRCQYLYTFDPSICGAEAWISATISGSGDLQVSLYFHEAIQAVWSKDFGTSPIDCATIDDDLPLVSQGNAVCDTDSATCHAEAL